VSDELAAVYLSFGTSTAARGAQVVLAGLVVPDLGACGGVEKNSQWVRSSMPSANK
jgi:hypothetical protein